jgi:hypothetical protein
MYDPSVEKALIAFLKYPTSQMLITKCGVSIGMLFEMREGGEKFNSTCFDR